MKKKKHPTPSLRKDELQKQLKRKDSAVERMKRELKIEAALEKVRARTMAMQKSDELQDAAIILFQQIKSLGVQTGSCGFNIWEKDEKAATVWMSSAEGALQAPFKMPHTVSAIYKKVYKAMKNAEDFLVKEVGGKTLEKHFDYLLTVPGIGDVIKHLRETGYVFPETMVYHFAFFNNGYLSFHLHEHHPDTHNIFKRFAKVFEQTYTRFLDLQKAEAQARDATVEAALEKVRSRSLAMHKSDEIKEVVVTVMEKMNELNIEMNGGVSLVTFIEGSQDLLHWYVNPEHVDGPLTMHLPYFDNVVFNDFVDARKDGKEVLPVVYSFEDKNKYFEYAFEHSDFNKAPDDLKKWILAQPYFGYSVAIQKHAAIFFNDYTGKLFSEKENEILIRFAKVFDQAYTRFLDLQKAEDQAREATIEAALERVRFHTIAMNNSDDVGIATIAMFSELEKLELKNIRVGIAIFQPNQIAEVWSFMKTEDGKTVRTSGTLDMNATLVWQQFYKGWQQKKDFFYYFLAGEEKKAYYKVLSNSPNYSLSGKMPELPDQYFQAYYFPEGAIWTYSLNLHSEEHKQILKKFTAVFSLTFRRYQDLKKAEAQAREAQIEASLERVRSSMMAMHQSDGLPDAMKVIADQLLLLGIRMDAVLFFPLQVKDGLNFWSANTEKTIPIEIVVPYKDNTLINEIRKSITNQSVFSAFNLSGDEIQDWWHHIIDKSNAGSLFSEQRKQYLLSSRYFSCAVSSRKNSTLSIANYSGIQFSEEENSILKRYANVFEQTYTRFLDLQKAETQAREAQIELSLERVRAKTMAMHNSQHVADTVATMFDEFVKLGIKNFRCGIGIMHQAKQMEVWTAKPEANGKVKLFTGYLDMMMHALLQGAYSAWENKDESYRYELKGDDQIKYFNGINNHPDYPLKYDIASLPPRLIHSEFYFAEGTLFVFSEEELTAEATKIFKRFAGVFGQTYRRYLDLKKAEAQARSAQIEAAMEKVRARSLAMQKPEELIEVAEVLRKEMGLLGVEELETSSIYIVDEEKQTAECWYAIKDVREGDKKLVSDHMIVNLNHTWVGREMQHFYSSSEKQISILMQGENRKDWINYCAARSKVLQGYYGEEIPERIYHLVKFSNGYIGAASPGNISTESWDLLQRATNVFSFAYTRFQDLQNAEIRAREAQIELALERVRARTMAMHSSEDVTSATATMFTELEKLGIENVRGGIAIISENKTMEVWGVTNIADGKTVKGAGTFDMGAHPLWQQLFKGWENKNESFIGYLAGKEKEDYIKIINSNPGYLSQPLVQLPDMNFQSYYFGQGAIWTYSLQPHSEEDKQVMKRFSSVFSLTFRRYQDLQKAEAQAREAQIEASLERIRSRAMAMHKTDELLDAAELVYKELSALGVASMSINYAFVDDEEKNASYYSINPVDGKIPQFPFIFPHTETDVMRTILSGWKKQEPFSLIELDEEATRKHQTYIGEIIVETMIKNNINIPFSLEAFLAISPKKAVIYTFNFSKGYLFIIGSARLTKPQEEMVLRFTKVFEMTYRRFLDLKQAEAQAREAKIEAALEKVRGKAMAMHNSNDLSVTASMVFTELRRLGINPIRSGVGLISKGSHKATLYGSTTSDQGDSLALVGWVMLEGHPVLINQYDYWARKEDYFPVLKGELLKTYYEKLSVTFSVPIEQSDYEQYGYFLMFSEGFLFCWSQKPYNETEINILSRFKAIIDLTFRRYLELQKSEANAKEAVKQSALDRVRADIASMRTVSDLDRITPLIWNELTVLGIPFVRCGVFIMDDQLEQIHTFLSTPDGKAIAAFHIPYGTPGNIQQVLSHWQQKENYIDHWDEKAFIDFAETLVKQGALASSEQYLQTIPHGGFHLHFLPFLQGMLYVGNSKRLDDEEIRLIQSVADAFATAYARYEDFNKLEAAKQIVEKTLVDLKQAQQQLVQSEKMASLGELTAGIAHEIQNPLNFVNNFSEVNTELIEEMKDEINKGNLEEVKAIANDIRENEQKINHHGKRADAIVKGMLQHSRSSTSEKQPTNINALTDEYLRLAYHGLRAKDNSFNATMKTEFDESIGNINIVPQDIGRVLLNLYNNAFYAVSEKKKQQSGEYEPTISVSTENTDKKITITVRDNGNGIPQKALDKIFQPFFTTKPTGQGTGLGLSLSYDIIKAHGGEIKVETKEGGGSEFIIQLPI
jgi:signal transduction histidine kinase